MVLYLASNGSACHCETECPARHVPYVHRELSVKVYLQGGSLPVGMGQLFFRNVARRVGKTILSSRPLKCAKSSVFDLAQLITLCAPVLGALCIFCVFHPHNLWLRVSALRLQDSAESFLTRSNATVSICCLFIFIHRNSFPAWKTHSK